MIRIGLALPIAAAAGWLATTVATALAAQPREVEDLTAAWTAAGPTPLGGTATVPVPQGRTLVAFLVGTELRGTAGTSTGTCTATAGGRALTLHWPVHINPSLTGALTGGQEIVAIAGWRNDGPPVEVRISCEALDSDVADFVAVATRTGALEDPPWFQPWAWIALGGAGVALTAAGVARGS